MDTLDAIKSRKSIRSYLPRQIEKQKSDALVEAGKRAPKAAPLNLTVIENREMLRYMNDLALKIMKSDGNEFLQKRAALPGYEPFYGAPCLILISSDADPFGMATASCAAMNIITAATDLGLGSCYVISPTLALKGDAKLSERLGIAKGLTGLCGVLVGYADTNRFETGGGEVSVNYIK